MSATIRSLVGRGLVSKVRDERDRRAVRLYATPQARRDLDSLRQIWLSRLLVSLDAAGVDEGERSRLVHILEGVQRYL
jgi:DNA-binding MarR family transcriptional regulator